MKKSIGASTIAYPAPTWIIGTYDSEGKPNIMTIAWGGICCSKPPCIAVALRKATYTHGNIVDRKAFTVNIPSAQYVKEADYLGLVSGKDTDKFRDTGLTPSKSSVVDAPYVEEFPVVLECRLVQTVEIGSHTQFIGEIIDVKADEAVLSEKGMPDIEKVEPIIFAVPLAGKYVTVGRYLGEAFSIGKEVKRSAS